MKTAVDLIGFGLILWGIGFILGMALFPFVDLAVMGWIIIAIWTPVAVALTFFRFRKQENSSGYYFGVGVVWAALAATLDFLILVLAFAAEDFYDLDIFIYYGLTLAIPIVVGLWVGRESAAKPPVVKPQP